MTNAELSFHRNADAASRGKPFVFIVKNGGKIKREIVLGTIKELQAHAALMLKLPEVEPRGRPAY